MSETQKVLVVDDESQITRVLRHSLTAHLYDVRPAADVLSHKRGTAVTDRAIVTAIWGGNFAEQTESLRVFVGQLRKKIEKDPSQPKYIRTEPWVGYRFQTSN